MGQSYCVGLCGQRNQMQPLQIEGITNFVSDQPLETVARKVKQHIEISHKIKDIYLMYRTEHMPERKGNKLELYYLFAYSAYYEGQWRNGLPHGLGRLIYDDGSIYQGCFNGGIAHCQQALFIKNDGTFYRGQIKNNKANGEGQLSTHKLFYKGQWVNDLPHGMAKEVYSQNSYYEGMFQKGMKQGQGVYFWNKFDSYRGMFQKNKLEGRGKLQTKEYIYEGEFKNNKKHGTGTYTHKTAKFIYTGSFRQNYPKGAGNILYQDGTKFKGQFNTFSKRRGVLIMTSGQQIQFDTEQFMSEEGSFESVPKEKEPLEEGEEEIVNIVMRG